MTSPTEQEIVARAIKDVWPFGLQPDDIAKLHRFVHALDQFRAKNAGEVERRLQGAAEYHASNADNFESDINPESVFAEEDQRVLAGMREHVASIKDAANLISTLRSAIAERDEALKPFAALCNDDLCPDGNDDDADWFRHDGYCLKNGDLRRARSSLSDGVK